MRISDWSSDVCSSDLCARMLLAMGADAERLWLCDIHGVLHSERADLNRWTQRFARATEARTLADVAAGADVLIGVSAAGDRKSVVWGKSVSVRVALGGRRIIKKKN